MWWILFVIVVFLIFTIYMKLKNKNKYWIERGIKQGSPVLLFGDQLRAIARNESLSEMVQRVYNVGGDDRYCGAYDFLSPALVIKDPDLIKDITIKDFDYFVDHKRVIPKDSDPIWDQNLFFLEGQKWKDMRSTLSPVFTGAKMRYMFSLIRKNAEQFVQHFLKQEKDLVSIELKDTFTRFTSNVIANTVFGFESNALEERESKFFIMSKKITDFGGIVQAFKMIGFFIFPSIYKEYKIKLLSSEVSNFFYNIVKENIQSRRERQITRPDMINLLMEARENHKLIHGVEITDEDITAQTLVFFFAGFDTMSSLMCFMAYELAINPDIQQRLIEEIEKTAESFNELNYDVINNMKYLDMVVSETLRKWPISPFVTRVCTKPYTIEPKRPNEQPIHLEKDAIIYFPIYALHRDPKHYPDPEKFDPERFNEGNKIKINQYIYVPFGSGPRKCIGYRFALLEIKILFFYLLSTFEITVIEKTQIPVRICKKSINMTPEGKLLVGLKRRNK